MNININIDDINSDDFLFLLKGILKINFKIDNCIIHSFNNIDGSSLSVAKNQINTSDSELKINV